MLVRSRLAAVASLALAAGALASGGPVVAATGNIDYSCQIFGNYSFTFTFDQDTNLPANAFVGRKYASTYSAKTSLPEGGVTIARNFDVDHFDGAIDATVLVNGVGRNVHAPIPKTKVPASGGIVLTAKGPLSVISKSGIGNAVLQPGTIKFTVHAYKADNSEVFGVDKANCDMTPNSKTIDTVKFVRSPTTIGATATYAKATKKVTSTAKVKAKSGLVPTGTVTATLYRGTTAVKTITSKLSAGKATAVFTGVKKKGAYKVVTTYGGNGANLGSAATRSFTVK